MTEHPSKASMDDSGFPEMPEALIDLTQRGGREPIGLLQNRRDRRRRVIPIAELQNQSGRRVQVMDAVGPGIINDYLICQFVYLDPVCFAGTGINRGWGLNLSTHFEIPG